MIKKPCWICQNPAATGDPPLCDRCFEDVRKVSLLTDSERCGRALRAWMRGGIDVFVQSYHAMKANAMHDVFAPR